MPTRAGVLGSYEYPEPKPVSERLDSLEPAVQARPAPAASRKAAIDHLTPGQLEGLMNDHRDASYSAARARLDIANLLKARQQGFRTSETMLTEQKAKHYYDSASDKTLQTVDRHLADLERYLDAVASGGREKGGYRALTPYELEKQAKSGGEFAGTYTADHPDTVGINYPAYSRQPRWGRAQTLLHEWLHRVGVTLGDENEFYDQAAVDMAGTPGGTDRAVNKNADNTAMFAARPWSGPVFSPVSPWPPFGSGAR